MKTKTTKTVWKIGNQGNDETYETLEIALRRAKELFPKIRPWHIFSHDGEGWVWA